MFISSFIFLFPMHCCKEGHSWRIFTLMIPIIFLLWISLKSMYQVVKKSTTHYIFKGGLIIPIAKYSHDFRAKSALLESNSSSLWIWIPIFPDSILLISPWWIAIIPYSIQDFKAVFTIITKLKQGNEAVIGEALLVTLPDLGAWNQDSFTQ